MFMAMPVSTLLAQDLTGTWQGTLAAGGRNLRLVFKVAKADDGSALKSTLHSIDQGGQGIGGTASLQGTTAKITIAGIGGAFEGKIGADGKTIAGTWTQGPGTTEITLTRATPETAWAIPEPPPRLKPMAADAKLVFEVATIKPSRPDARGSGITVRGRQFVTINTPLRELITFAYGIHAKQIAGIPAWAESDRYDINAQPEAEGAPNDKQLKAMLQKLLAERFKLTFHNEKKELSVYTIAVGKNGPKLTASQADPNGLPGLGFRGLGAMIVRNATMDDFSTTMQGYVLDRPVVNQTGLSGRFDFTLNWTPDEFQFANLLAGAPRPPAPADNAAAPPDIYTAMQEQIGLKLSATKAPADVLVIDKVEKPSEN
jgi:uncharacterized protein (TIGR03435 family)